MAMGVKRKTPTARLSRYVVRSWNQFSATLQNMRTQPSRRNTHTNVLFAERSCLRCLNAEGEGSCQAKLRRASRLLMSVLKSGGRGLPKTHGTSLYAPSSMHVGHRAGSAANMGIMIEQTEEGGMKVG